MKTNLNPVYKLQNGQKLNSLEFIKYFEEKVFKTIRRFNLFEMNDLFGIAVSGGKDSITVLYLTHKYLKRKGLEKNIKAIAIDEGISGYRENTLNFLKEFCKKLDVELNIFSYKDLYSKTLDESILILKNKNSNISACNICGTYRRNAINTKARELGVSKLITGHNLDDEAQSILLNIFKNNFKILSRLGPNNGIVLDEKFIPRIKPLYLCTEKEVRLYTILKNFDMGYDECPYAKDSFRSNIGDMINKLEDMHKGVKNSIVNFYLETKDSLKDMYIDEYGNDISYCEICKEPSQKKICNTCQMKNFVNKEL